MAVKTGKMEVAVRTVEGTYDVIEDDIPDIAPDQVLLEVRATGICGGDLHNWREPIDRLAGKRFGHEFSGVVADVGGDVESLADGDRVTFDPVISCGKCPYCRTGQAHQRGFRKIIAVRVRGSVSLYHPHPYSGIST